MFRKLINNFKLDNKKFLGIEITDTILRVSEIKKQKEKYILSQYGEISLGPCFNKDIGESVPNDEKKIAQKLAEILNESKINTNNCAFSISPEWSFVFNFESPVSETLSNDQVQNLAIQKVKKILPVPINKVLINARKISKYQDTSLGSSASKEIILVVVIYQNILDRVKKITSYISDLKLKFIEVKTFSIVRSTFTDEFNKGCVALLDLGDSFSSSISIVNNSVIFSQKRISFGLEKLTNLIAKFLNIRFALAKNFLHKRGVKILEGINDTVEIEYLKSLDFSITTEIDKLAKEINDYVAQNESEIKQKITKIVITGEFLNIKYLKEELQSKINVEIFILDSFNKIEIRSVNKDLVNDIKYNFSVSNGLAIRGLSK